jgi:hypothetical protein
LFQSGYGTLTVDEVDSSVSPANNLIVGSGILAINTVVSADISGNISLDFGDGDKVILLSALNGSAGKTYGVQQVHFSDGTVWSYDDLLARVGAVNASDSTLYGDSSAQIFDSLGVDSVVVGGGGGDTITYHRGYGALTIDEIDTNATPSNALNLGAGLSAANLAVKADASGNIILDFGGGDVITLQNGLKSAVGQTFGVQVIAFADGTTWHYSDLLGALGTPSLANSVLYGDASGNTLDGGGMAHTLVGNGGGDTFVFQKGYGAAHHQ